MLDKSVQLGKVVKPVGYAGKLKRDIYAQLISIWQDRPRSVSVTSFRPQGHTKIARDEDS